VEPRRRKNVNRSRGDKVVFDLSVDILARADEDAREQRSLLRREDCSQRSAERLTCGGGQAVNPGLGRPVPPEGLPAGDVLGSQYRKDVPRRQISRVVEAPVGCVRRWGFDATAMREPVQRPEAPARE
jgi:hypothetical protein